MNWWIVIPAAAIVIGAAATLIGVKRHERTREKIVMRVRTTELYGHIYPLLRRYDTENVESVTIRPQELSIRLMEPLGKCLRYTFRKHGLDQPEPEVLYVRCRGQGDELYAHDISDVYGGNNHQEPSSHSV